MANDLMQDLNPDQAEAVRLSGSPLLIIAGAGSGKTKVIVYKIAHLIKNLKYLPHNILGVTFTNKAAAEMRSRIDELTGIDSHLFNISTFHSLGLKILRESGEHLGFDRNWQILDSNDQKLILDKIIKTGFSYFTNDMRDSLRKKINLAKMNLRYPNDPDTLFEHGFESDEVKIYAQYHEYLKKNRSWDFEDLVSFAVILLQKFSDLREKYTKRFKYVVVDEFQDTNPNQYELIKLIAHQHRNIMIVGDDDQAIYSWRGASIRFLFEFEHDFPGARIIKLERNYRSTQKILNFANSLIENNRFRRGKSMWTKKASGNPVLLMDSRSKEDEAQSIARLIGELQHTKPELFPIAVLYRINSQSLSLETELVNHDIDFQIIRGLRFFERKEIKDSLALLKLTVNPDDDTSFQRVIDFLPLGIGPKTISQLFELSREKGISLFKGLKEYLPDKYLSKDLFKIIFELNSSPDQKGYAGLLDNLLKNSGYIEILKKKEDFSRLMNIEELVGFLSKWETESPDESFNDLLDRISLDRGAREKEKQAKVFLLTMHNAKGLEFPTVIVSGINAAFMPFFLRKGNAEIEEERRLFYVACTRAREQLIISTGSDRYSKFIYEIDSTLFSARYGQEDMIDAICGITDTQQNKPDHEDQKYLEHPIFGKGRIVNELDDHRYLIDFAEKGEKVIDTSVVKVKFI